MNKSESIKELATALSLAQGEMPAVQFNATNPFLKNKYADLGAVISTSKPVLAKYGLSVTQLTETQDNNVCVTTVMMHKSGEWMQSTASLQLGEERGKSLAQVAGSIVTYLRRYSLASILGMYADEDGDGNEPKKTDASKHEPVKHEPTPTNGNGHKPLAEAIIAEGGVPSAPDGKPEPAHDWENMTKGELAGRLNEYIKRLKESPQDEDALKKRDEAKYWLEQKNKAKQ